MPKVLSYTPSWLARPSPGFDLFQRKDKQSASSTDNGPNRTIAYRGSEVFVASGAELRWGELGLLRAASEAEEGRYEAHNGRGWRALKTPVVRPIRQIIISPDGTLIAIATSHTCHVCVLPSTSHLRSGDASPLRVKAFQLGPTAHVLEQAPIVSAIWHPLSPPNTPCLVTVTRDACVRLWELDVNNRHSFDEPALAVDLRKLANATSTNADFSASKYGVNRGFSPDEVEMEVAAACFGGTGMEDEHGWASMTLWVAMTEGDVYALCPLLPSKFRTLSTTLPSLSTSVVAKSRAVGADTQASEAEKRNSDTQCRWLADIDAQEPLLLQAENEHTVAEVYTRPERHAAIPKLQGPYSLTPEPDFGELTDIHVIAPTVDQAELFGEDELDMPFPGETGVSVALVCLATSTGHMHICLDLDGVEAEWLPSKGSRAFTFDEGDVKELLLFETVDLSGAVDEEARPAFTSWPEARYTLFVTLPGGVYSLDFKSWTTALEDELANAADSGAEFRLDLFLETVSTAVDELIQLSPSASEGQLPVAIASRDESLGEFVLTSTSSGPHMACIESPYVPSHPYEPEMLALPAPEAREPYQPAQEFFTQGQLEAWSNSKKTNAVTRQLIVEPMRFRPEILQLMTDAHRIVSQETHKLGLAAADLFRRCERMRSELQDQVRRVKEIAERVDSLTDVEEAEEFGIEEDSVVPRTTVNAKIEDRIIRVQSNTQHLNERIEGLRRRMLLLGGKELSAKERAYIEEINRLEASIETTPDAPVSPNALVHMPNGSPSDTLEDQDSPEEQAPATEGSLAVRLREAGKLRDELTDQAEKMAKRLEAQQEGGENKRQGGVGSEYKRQKLAQVMALLERETALVDAVSERLGRLGGLR